MRLRSKALLFACAVAAPGVASAQEVAVGVLAHGVNTPFTIDIGERGADIQVAYRFKRSELLSVIGKPAPYVIASLNTDGNTSFAGAGVAWNIGKGPVYFRPGMGLIVHDGPSYRADYVRLLRTDLGSRVLFQPEASIGVRIDERFAVEANWTHISHARLFAAHQNPGLDMMGLRVVMKLK